MKLFRQALRELFKCSLLKSGKNVERFCLHSNAQNGFGSQIKKITVVLAMDW
jgi:hypothetical protein